MMWVFYLYDQFRFVCMAISTANKEQYEGLHLLSMSHVSFSGDKPRPPAKQMLPFSISTLLSSLSA